MRSRRALAPQRRAEDLGKGQIERIMDRGIGAQLERALHERQGQRRGRPAVAVHRVATACIGPEHVVDEAIARIKQVTA